MMTEAVNPEPPQPAPRWQSLSAIDRRVAGVLVEKAKTTTSAYPMSLNAVTTGCNQKSNRSPLMNLEPDDVEESLDRLRELGAVGLVQGYGRVSKYRHYLYDWLGADKVELAVMAELLLRGPQTVGELRGRAARMEPIRDLADIEPVLASLSAKGLVLPLTRKGRGLVVTHALFSSGELDRLKAQYSAAAPEPPTAPALPRATDEQQAGPPTATDDVGGQTAETLRRAIEELRSQMAQIRSDVADLADAHERTEQEVRRLRDELGG